MNKIIIFLMLFIIYNILTTKKIANNIRILQNIKVDTSIIHPASIIV